MAAAVAVLPDCRRGSCAVNAPPAPVASGPESSPGGPAYGEALRARLAAALAAKGAGYQPRTRHRRPDGRATYVNRLVLESSPYLLQHAHNPVNWYPWADEAFQTARALGRPVFLSVGYSTCHWCHVMEEESFEDEEIARYLNEHYVAIKVDREERPDVDAIYMNAVQMLTGGGGWPMSVWLTPDRKPFFGGTYFPARDGDRGIGRGFLSILREIAQSYGGDPAKVASTTEQLTLAIRRNLAPAPAPSSPGPQVLHDAAQFYEERFDPVWGGLDRAPKFPSSVPARFLLRYHRRTGEERARHMAVFTLEKMAAGGMHDHVGGGFHRYATDRRWLVPHFEKMLYDNALLALAYLDGFQSTGRADFAEVARDILRYVERDMTSPEGAFYSATDADSLNPHGHREEGWFFTWTPDEIALVLGAERARPVLAYFAVTPQGNFEGRSILSTPRPAGEVAKELGMPEAALRASVAEAREILYAARARRPPPLRDEKILAAWNGLMISAFARASLVLGEPGHAARAARAADFVLGRMRDVGRLRRSFKDGVARFNGYLDDYAFVAAGLVDLYEATGDPRWVTEAIALDRVLAERFEDAAHGGFFMTSDDHEALLAREKPAYDGAEPSGNSVHALTLLRLHALTGHDASRRRAEKALTAFANTLRTQPAALSEMLLALDFHTDVAKEIVVVAPGSRAEAEPFLARWRSAFLPNAVLAVVAEADREAQRDVVPLVADKVTQKGRTTAYVCENRVCELPTTDPEAFAKQVAKARPLSR